MKAVFCALQFLTALTVRHWPIEPGSGRPKLLERLESARAPGVPPMRMPYQMRPGCRVVTSWTSHVLPSGSLKEKNDP
jgi:hypothetical protein